MFLEVCNVTPTYRKSWAKNLLMWSDFTLDSSFKVKRLLIGFGEFYFWWIQFASVLQCARSSFNAILKHNFVPSATCILGDKFSLITGSLQSENCQSTISIQLKPVELSLNAPEKNFSLNTMCGLYRLVVRVLDFRVDSLGFDPWLGLGDCTF